MPQRLQRSRVRGYRMPEGAVYVGRPTCWGNPFRVGHFYSDRTSLHQRPQPRGTDAQPGTYHHEGFYTPWTETIALVRDRAHAVELFRAYIAYENIDWSPGVIRHHLAGRDLACWCPIAAPCHADVLLSIAAGKD